MSDLKQVYRLLVILRTIIKYRLDEFIFYDSWHYYRYFFYMLPWNWCIRASGTRSQRLRAMLEELGTIYIKIGQILSTRRDVLPEDIAKELALLQDRVIPFSGVIAKEVIEQAYGLAIEEVFLEFNETPAASASVAQVHEATLKDGRKFMIKVIRPDIEKTIMQDISLFEYLSKKSDQYYPDSKSLRFNNVVHEIKKTLLNELDLKREAANASQLRRNFKDEKQYYVPDIHWELTHRNVLAIEYVSGIPISDVDGLIKSGINLKWLAEYCFEIFFTQVFRDNYFHADMHPGNIFVQPSINDQLPKVAVIDFGIMASLTDFDQYYLAENFLAFLDHDYHRVAILHIESGWVPADTRIDEFESSIRTVCEPLLDKPIREISFGELLQRLFEIALSFDVEIMPQLLMLQKTIINIEGIGRMLYPDLDPWKIARPQLEHWMQERVGLKKMYKKTKNNIPHWLNKLPSLPYKIINVIDKLHDGKIELDNKSQDLKKLRMEIKHHNRTMLFSLLGSTCFLGVVITLTLADYSTFNYQGVPVITWFMSIMSLLFFLLAAKR